MGKFTEGRYAKDWQALPAFADLVAPATRERLLFKNAQGFYDDPSKANEEQFPARQSVINKPKNARNRLSVISATQKTPDWLSRGAAKQVGVLHRDAGSMRQLDTAPPSPKFL